MILRAAKRRKGLILFEDEASFAQWGLLRYTWARRGQQPEVKTSGTRKGYKVFGAMESFSGRLCYSIQEKDFPNTRLKQPGLIRSADCRAPEFLPGYWQT